MIRLEAKPRFIGFFNKSNYLQNNPTLGSKNTGRGVFLVSNRRYGGQGPLLAFAVRIGPDLGLFLPPPSDPTRANLAMRLCPRK